jgi:predicted nucleotidyltransferase
MKDKFDSEQAKKFLIAKEEKERAQREENRKGLLQKTTSVLEREFKGSSVEVYLIGSILQPFNFTARSDIDIVLKNYQGDRFEFWAKLEREIGRRVEIIPFETCRFQELVLKNGFRVV